MHKANWDDLRIVLAVVDARSVNAAAQKLGINHATVLRRLKVFEERHGLTLFHKSSSGYRVDPAAQKIVETIRSVDRSVDAFERAITGQEDQPSGDVRVTSTDSLCLDLLPKAIAELRTKNSGLRVTLVSTNAHLNLSKLDADITVRPARALPENLTGHRVCKMTFRSYATPSYLEKDVVPAHWLGVSDHLMRSPVGAWMEENAGRKVILNADSFVSLTAMAATGLGAAILPTCLGDPDPRLVRVEAVPVRLETSLWIATHNDVSAVPRVQAVVSHLAASLKQDVSLIDGD